MPKSRFYGWKLLGVLWVVLLVNLAFPAYGSTVINTYMAADLHLDREMLGLPYSVYLVMSGLPAPLVAICVNRRGVRFTLLLGGALVIVGSLVMALFVSSGLGAVVAFGLIVGTGVATGGALPTQTSVTRWFVRRRALALAILLSGGGIGGFIAAPLLDKIIRISGGNWRAGWLVVAALSSMVAFVIALFVKESPKDLGISLARGVGARHTDHFRRHRAHRGRLGLRPFWHLQLLFLLYRRRVSGWRGVADHHPATDARSCKNRRSRC